MKVLIVNAVCGITSTGKICVKLAQKFESEGDICKIAYGRDGYVPKQFQKYSVRIGNDLDVKIHGIYTRLFDKHGLGSRRATKKFLHWAEEYNPDLLWLHNLHGYYINYEMLFKWIKSRPEMLVKWTLHDCWAFTGHCTHYMFSGCEQWKKECTNHCLEIKSYPASLFLKNCKNNYERKKKAFSNVHKMQLIVPSRWMEEQVNNSFLKEYQIKVQYNTIDYEVFRPRESLFREQYNIEDKYMILGVANNWKMRKGFEDFLQLSSLIDENSCIVLVGVTKEEIKRMPSNMIGIKRTNTQEELAEIYSTADVFVNLTYEDNFPTVNLEAEACGTRVITYGTGGASETIKRKDSVVVTTGNIMEIQKFL